MELKSVSKEFMAEKKLHRNIFCGQYYEMKSVKKRKGNYSGDKDHNGAITTGSTGTTNILNSHYPSVFCCDHNIPKI